MSCDLTILGCVFYENIASDGSAIYYEEADLKTLVLNSNVFAQNFALENGAVLFVAFSSAIIIESCNFINNSIHENQKNLGAVVYLNNPGNLSIHYSNFENNLFGSVKIITFNSFFSIYNLTGCLLQ